MDTQTVHLLIQKRRNSARFYIDNDQYSLQEVITYVRLHPARVLHIITLENGQQLLEGYVPTTHEKLQLIIELAAKAKIYITYKD
ncbi:hypothetical protein CN918_26580 [Priestia megaterium]|nr:hypothetical protein CN918_26580 [Priestia megaterium]